MPVATSLVTLWQVLALSGCGLGAKLAAPIAAFIADKASAVHTLNLVGNELRKDGGLRLARALVACVDLGENLPTLEVALGWKSLNLELEDNALGRAGLTTSTCTSLLIHVLQYQQEIR